jgi:hypothetical protein
MNTISKLILTGVIGLFTACNEAPEVTTATADPGVAALDHFEKYTGGAQLTFNKYEHDFGTVKKGHKLKQSFYFVNSGDAPLVISNAKGSCGCTIPFFPKDPIQPGEKGQIDVEIDANNKESDKVFEVSVKVESNAENNLVKLKLKGIPQE